MIKHVQEKVLNDDKRCCQVWNSCFRLRRRAIDRHMLSGTSLRTTTTQAEHRPEINKHIS